MIKYKKRPSLLYSSPTLYHLVIRFLYGKHFNTRYQLIADLIPNESSAIDICAGDAYLFQKYLKKKSVRYTGIDNSTLFVKWAKKRGINYKKLNIFQDEIPKADYIIMMGSLFQFHPLEKEILQKLIKSAKIKAIISEPIVNITSSKISVLARIANHLTIPFDSHPQYTGERFNEFRLNALFKSFPNLESSIKIPGGREIIGVFKGEG